jgi:hypothetical protein
MNIETSQLKHYAYNSDALKLSHLAAISMFSLKEAPA